MSLKVKEHYEKNYIFRSFVRVSAGNRWIVVQIEGLNERHMVSSGLAANDVDDNSL